MVKLRFRFMTRLIAPISTPSIKYFSSRELPPNELKGRGPRLFAALFRAADIRQPDDDRSCGVPYMVVFVGHRNLDIAQKGWGSAHFAIASSAASLTIQLLLETARTKASRLWGSGSLARTLAATAFAEDSSCSSFLMSYTAESPYPQ